MAKVSLQCPLAFMIKKFFNPFWSHCLQQENTHIRDASHFNLSELIQNMVTLFTTINDYLVDPQTLMLMCQNVCKMFSICLPGGSTNGNVSVSQFVQNVFQSFLVTLFITRNAYLVDPQTLFLN